MDGLNDKRGNFHTHTRSAVILFHGQSVLFLFTAVPTVIFPAAEHHPQLATIELHCLYVRRRMD